MKSAESFEDFAQIILVLISFILDGFIIFEDMWELMKAKFQLNEHVKGSSVQLLYKVSIKLKIFMSFYMFSFNCKLRISVFDSDMYCINLVQVGDHDKSGLYM